MRTTSVHRGVLACLLLAFALCVGARTPTVTASNFANLPSKLSYFDDSSVVLWHDAESGTVFRSDNEGKSWKAVSGPPSGKAMLLIEHPYDPKQAFILSNAEEHWRTTDRGATWQRFRTPDPPAVRAGIPLDFHADEKHRTYILYTGRKCSKWSPLRGSVCHDVAYYTTDAFATDVKQAMDVVLRCNWAKTTREVVVPQHAMTRIFCLAWDESVHQNAPTGQQSASKTRMWASDDFFKTRRIVDLGLGRDARGFMGLGASRRYLITALQDPTQGRGKELSLYVSLDAETWSKAQFPHGQLLHESAYTILDGPQFHLLVDVLDAASNTGSLFMSDSSGTQFGLSLHGTQRNAMGIVDYEHLANIDGVAIANIRTEAALARVKTKVTHDEGSHWTYLAAPRTDVDGHSIGCNTADPEHCALHLHALVQPHNLGRTFSSSAPGLVMGVGSVGEVLKPYDDCDTFLSTDAGATWTMVARHPHKYEFGDQGGLLVLVPDTGATDVLRYSFNYKTWHTLQLGTTITPFVLTTIPDSTALKFLLIGSRARGAGDDSQRHAALFVDFAPLKKRKCGSRDFEQWYPQGPNGACLMGHRQWYRRRKADADCVVLDKFHDPVAHVDPCQCTEADYECDFGFVRAPSGKCEPSGAIAVPPGACQRKGDTFTGSSGYRKVPGNTCEVRAGQKALDAPVQRPCTQVAPPAAGAIQHQRFAFPSAIADVLHFANSPHVVVRLMDGQIFQSADDGGTWHELKLLIARFAERKALALISHAHDKQRAFIVSDSQAVFYTTDGGVHWQWFSAPLAPNVFGLAPLDFHPTQPDWLIWTGSRGCETPGGACHTEAYYSLNNGRQWSRFDTYVRKCAWLRDTHFAAADTRAILCESHTEKKGSQPLAARPERTLQLVLGNDLYRKKHVLFEKVLGFSVFEEFLHVAEVVGVPAALRMHVSMDAHRFAEIQLPPQLDLERHAYTVLDSVTRAVFMHVSPQQSALRQWGDLVKSNSNGTYYALSQEGVNRNALGYVDFEKMRGIHGIALTNVVSNQEEAAISGLKALQTRITHNDGGHWDALTPPVHDSHGNPYACNEVGCSLHLHGLLERPDLRLMTSTPAATGFMLGTGNVGRALAPYRDCDTFLTRDGGFTWEEVHKDAHKWAMADHGAILLLVDDERPTDEVLYTLDQGLSWKSFKLGERMRVATIDALPEESERRFVLFGQTTQVQKQSVAVMLDFTAVLPRKCVFDRKSEDRNDFERWSPGEQRDERCLFGAQRWYWRRKRDRACYVGDALPDKIEERQCQCTEADFEWYVALLTQRIQPLPRPHDPKVRAVRQHRGARRVGRGAVRAQCARVRRVLVRAHRGAQGADLGVHWRPPPRPRRAAPLSPHADPPRLLLVALDPAASRCDRLRGRLLVDQRRDWAVRVRSTTDAAPSASRTTPHTTTRASTSGCSRALSGASRRSRGRARRNWASTFLSCATTCAGVPSVLSPATTCCRPTKTPRYVPVLTQILRGYDSEAEP